MDIIKRNGKSPYAIVGPTSLADKEYFSHYGKTGIDVVCSYCGFPFAISMQKHGRVNDVVICFNCDKESAVILIEGENIFKQ